MLQGRFHRRRDDGVRLTASRELMCLDWRPSRYTQSVRERLNTVGALRRRRPHYFARAGSEPRFNTNATIALHLKPYLKNEFVGVLKSVRAR